MFRDLLIMEALFHILPGYLPVPSATVADLKTYIEKFTPKTKRSKERQLVGKQGKYITSYLKAIWAQTGPLPMVSVVNGFQSLMKAKTAHGLCFLTRCLRENLKASLHGDRTLHVQVPMPVKLEKHSRNSKWMVNVNLFDNAKKRCKQRSFNSPAPPPLKRKGASQIQVGLPNGDIRLPSLWERQGLTQI